MRPVTLLGQPVERCERDGVWFDRRELEAVLVRAPEARLELSPAEQEAAVELTRPTPRRGRWG